jgi:opacity protein-like surface antigen
MKTKFFFLCCMVAFNTIGTKAQYSYAGISIGYGTGLPVYSLGSSTTVSGNSTTYTLEKGNYGQGLNFGLSIGSMLNKNIGVEFGMSYLIGSKKEFIISSSETDTTSGRTTVSEGTITLDKIKMIRLNPSFKITLGDQVRPYLRMGIIIGLGTSYSRQEETILTTSGSFSDTVAVEKVRDYTGGAAFGFNSAFGLDIDLTDNLVFFGELSFSSISWAATESKITRYFYDGVDLIPSTNPDALKTEYVDDYTLSASTPVTQRELKTYLPFGSFAISAGVVYTFGEE